MESGVHGVESEAAVCPGRRISGVSGSRWTSCGAGTGARDTLEGVAGITIPPEQPQSLPKALLRHPTVRYRARRPPRRSPGLAHFVIPRPGLRQTPRGLSLRAFYLSRPPVRSLSLRSGNSPTTPYGGRVNGLQVIGSSPPCHPNYRALALTPAGLSPAERASLCWTHQSLIRFSWLPRPCAIRNTCALLRLELVTTIQYA